MLLIVNSDPRNSSIFFPCCSTSQVSLTLDVLLFAAIKAAEVGVAGIMVSNHGARQLDYTDATINVLEEVCLY